MGFASSSRIIPSIDASLTGNVDDWAPAGLHGAEWLRVDANGNYYITGVQAGAHGEQLTITNVDTTNTVDIYHDSASSSEADRILVGGPTDAVGVKLHDGCSATLRYDGTSARWRVISHTGEFSIAG